MKLKPTQSQDCVSRRSVAPVSDEGFFCLSRSVRYWTMIDSESEKMVQTVPTSNNMIDVILLVCLYG